MKKRWCWFVVSFVFQEALFSQFQAKTDSAGLFFLSDCQQPMVIEKFFLPSNHNIEARDCLFADLVDKHPGNLFLLGDLTSLGSRKKTWVAVDHFLRALRHSHTNIYAIPGNHEYKINPRAGIRNFQQRFPGFPSDGYSVRMDSIAVIMLNSNFSHLSPAERGRQLLWYRAAMDSFDRDQAIKAIVVAAHHPPYSNSKVVGSSMPVQQYFVEKFESSRKARLFITGHSHNLEYFTKENNKHFLVIGGGGGLTQPLVPEGERKYNDLLPQEQKPLFFYVVISHDGDGFVIKSRGLTKDLCHFTDQDVAKIAW